MCCGQERVLQAWGRCPRCYKADPAMVHRCADKLAERLDPAPAWLAEFGVYLAERLSPTRAVRLLRQLADLLEHTSPSPGTVLRAAEQPCSNPAGGGLARALRAFFVASGHALPADTAGQAAARRRSRRVDEIPTAFRPVVAKFDTHQLDMRERARRAATKPRTDRTLEINLAAVRDLARFLTTHRPRITDWSIVNVADIEAFLATITNPAYRARQLHALRVFFRFARRARHILIDPTRELTGQSNIGFHGQVVEPTRQRALFERWTTHATHLHPHEPAAGLLGLLHAASVAELRHLRLSDIDLAAASARLGHRPHPTPLDPATTDALRRCVELHHRADTTAYLFTCRRSKTINSPVSVTYLERLLAPAGVTPMRLRATRLAQLVTTIDPMLVAAAFGIRHGAALHYLADHVDTDRLPQP